MCLPYNIITSYNIGWPSVGRDLMPLPYLQDPRWYNVFYIGLPRPALFKAMLFFPELDGPIHHFLDEFLA